jgi:hypothetical protein
MTIDDAVETRNSATVDEHANQQLARTTSSSIETEVGEDAEMRSEEVRSEKWEVGSGR